MEAFEPKSLLLPTDFSTAASLAMPYARALANEYEASLVVLHVVTQHLEHLGDEVVTRTADPRVVRLAEQAERALQDLNLGTSPQHTHREVLCASSAATGILAAMKRHETDLVVISTHGRGVLGRLVLGSVTADVVSHSPCPVLCIKSHEHGMLDVHGALHVKRLLIGVDASEPNDAVMKLGLTLAKQWQAELHIMDITHPQLSPFFFPEGVVTFVEDVDARVAAETQLNRWLQAARAGGITPKLANDDLIHAGNLSGYASAHDVDLIVVQRRTHGRLPFTIGGGPENLMHDVRCPLWIL